MTHDAVAAATALARNGRAAAAVATLEAAGERGGATAWAELAVWYLRGDTIPRDLPAARDALRLAVAIGHVDAALMEVALTANGTGGPADWVKAVRLLAEAACHDQIAAAHHALIGAMALDREGFPASNPAIEILSERPFVARAVGAVTRAECLHVAAVGAPLLEPGLVIDPASRRAIPHPVRTSFSATVGPAQETLPVAAINRRLAALTDTALDAGEPLHVLRYAPGQQYRLHSDALPGERNQRLCTAIVYLNDGFRGGETEFPAAGLRIIPAAGDVLIFRNSINAVPDPDARHAGLPVTTGQKWIATRWIRQACYDPWQQL